MKALLVLDDKDKLSLLKTKLSKAGFDTICYQWLMKALDNIEENYDSEGRTQVILIFVIMLEKLIQCVKINVPCCDMCLYF